MRRTPSLLEFILLVSFVFSNYGCRDKKDKEFLVPEETFLDYQVTAAEGDDNLTILIQFRNGEDGDGLRLMPPASIKLDGVPIDADTTSKGKWFYETFRSIDSFTGKHNIVYTDIKNRQFTEEFEFEPLVLTSLLPDTISDAPLLLQFSGIRKNEHVQVVYRDTSFNKDDSWQLLVPGEDRIELNSEALQRMDPGPVQFEFIKEFRRRLNSTFGGR